MRFKKRILVGIVTAIGMMYFLSQWYFPPVIVYHKISESDLKSPYHLSPKNFVDQMYFLKAHQYHVLSLRELIAMIKQGKQIPKKSVVICIYGGWESNFVHAFPILKELDLTATFFVRASDLGREGYLTLEDLQILRENQLDIGLIADSREEFEMRRVLAPVAEEDLLIARMQDEIPISETDVYQYQLFGGILMNSSVSGTSSSEFKIPSLDILQNMNNLLLYWWALSGYAHYLD